MTTPYGVRNITRERAAADELPAGPQRDLAQFRVDVLVHTRNCQKARETGISEQCNKIDAFVDGVANGNRPYIHWECCDAHRALKTERAQLNKRAAELGVEVTYDVMQTIED